MSFTEASLSVFSSPLLPGIFSMHASTRSSAWPDLPDTVLGATGLTDAPREFRETNYFTAIGSCITQILDAAVAPTGRLGRPRHQGRLHPPQRAIARLPRRREISALVSCAEA